MVILQGEIAQIGVQKWPRSGEPVNPPLGLAEIGPEGGGVYWVDIS